MTRDEFYQELQATVEDPKYRGRFTWRFNPHLRHQVRVTSIAGTYPDDLCPVTFLNLIKTGKFLSEYKLISAGVNIGLSENDACIIANAADCRGDYDHGDRARLLQALGTVLGTPPSNNAAPNDGSDVYNVGE